MEEDKCDQLKKHTRKWVESYKEDIQRKKEEEKNITGFMGAAYSKTYCHISDIMNFGTSSVSSSSLVGIEEEPTENEMYFRTIMMMSLSSRVGRKKARGKQTWIYLQNKKTKHKQNQIMCSRKAKKKETLLIWRFQLFYVTRSFINVILFGNKRNNYTNVMQKDLKYHVVGWVQQQEIRSERRTNELHCVYRLLY